MNESKRGVVLSIAFATFASLTFAFLVLTAVPIGAYSSSNTISGTVNVPYTCYITLSVNSINFGVLAPGAYATNGYTASSVTDNDVGGNINSDMLIAGGNWISGSQNFGVGNTLWAATNILDTSANALAISPVDTGIVIAQSAGNTVYMGLEIPAGQASGTYTQNIIVTNSC